MYTMSDANPPTTGLWVAPVGLIVFQAGIAVLFLLVAVTHLLGDDPSSWDRAMGFAAAAVCGLGAGATMGMWTQRRMVERHLNLCHGGVEAPTSRT